ncbi:MAG: pyridine nucleotide-disulfide oxidoreductase, partial [Acidimicrobiia bacterium]
NAESLDDFFLRLEAAGVLLRIDTSVTPTMAKTPTLGRWELELLRTIEHVIRLGHIEGITSSEITLADGSVPLPADALVVHCAASGLQYPPRVPLWSADAIRLQTIRFGFPCFNAAIAGYIEATRDDDTERNRLCPPNSLPNRPDDWSASQARGLLATRGLGAEPDLAAWFNGCALNPARIDPSRQAEPDVQAAMARMADVAPRGLPRMAELGQGA